MLLSGCKGNTFFWKSAFFYGLIYIQSEKTQKKQTYPSFNRMIWRRFRNIETSVFCSKKELNSRYFYPKYVKKNAAIEYFPRFKRL